MATAEADTSQEERGAPGGPVYDGFISYSHAADDLLAPRLQAGLQRFAKPWWKRRALRIFRDEASLSANPHLWSSITGALDQSGWFVVLLSPEAAESPWVNDEVEYWLRHKDPDRLIPVLTDGDFTWFDDDFISDAAPPALQGAFSNEPRWVDLRFARSEEQLDLKNPRFSAAVADIASAIRGVPKDELESEDVRQHRRTVRTAWGAGVVVLLLAILASAAAVYAIGQRNEAEQQRLIAEENAAAAEAAATAEADAKELAIEEAARALQAEQVARGEALAQASIVAAAQDVDRSLLLALAGIDASKSPTTVSALRSALAGHNAAAVMEWQGGRWESGLPAWHALSPDGQRIAVGAISPEGDPLGIDVELWNIGDEAPSWVTRLTDDATVAIQGDMFIDGAGQVIVSVASFTSEASEEEGYGIYVLSATDGTVTSFSQLDPCHWRAWPIHSASGSVDRVILGARPPVEAGGCDFSRLSVSVLDLRDGSITPVATHAVTWFVEVGASPDGSTIAFGGEDPVRLYNIESGEVQREFTENGASAISAAGDRVFMGGDPMVIRSTETGQLLAVLQSGGKFLWRAWWGRDDETIYALTQQGGEILVFDTETGVPLHTIYTPTSPVAASMSGDGTLLASSGIEPVVRLWELSTGVEGELPPIPTGAPTSARDAIGVLAAGGDLVLAPYTGEHIDRLAAPGGYQLLDRNSHGLIRNSTAWASGLSPDGTLIGEQPVLEENVTTPSGIEGATLVGPLRIVDAVTGDVVVELEGCSWYSLPDDIAPEPANECSYEDLDRAAQIVFDGDNSIVAAETWDASIAVWDTADGTLLWRTTPLGPNFQPNSPVAISANGQWIARSQPVGAVVVDARTGEEVAMLGDDFAQWSMVFDAAGERLFLGQSESLVVYDTETWESHRVGTDHGNSIRKVLLDESNRRVITVGTDSAIRVWDMDTLEKLDEMTVTGPVGNGLYGVIMLDATSIAVYGLQPGQEKRLLRFSLDSALLVEVGINRVTRGLVETECATYSIEPCPTTVGAVQDLYGE